MPESSGRSRYRRGDRRHDPTRVRANGHYWVFTAGATDVGYVLTVTDTLSDQVKVYTNTPGTPAPTVTDASAFATCE